MHTVVYAPEAEAHLLALFHLIAEASSAEIAGRCTDAIVAHCESLSTFPLRGARRDDIRQGLRVFGFRRRVSIAFEIQDEIVLILGVFYAGQSFEAAFEE